MLFLRYTPILLTLLLTIANTAEAAEEAEINIDGLNDEQEKNVRLFLSLTHENCESPQWRINKLFDEADGEIGEALSALGYYQPDIRKQLLFEESCWQADFDITAGEPVVVTKLSIQIQGEAEHEPVFKQLLASLPIKQGDVLNHALYEKTKQDLRSLALEYGYLDNRLTRKTLQVDPAKHQAEIDLVLDSGARHHFGEISINVDPETLDPEFVKRYLSFSQGDDYSSKQLAKTHNALAGSIYFSRVDIKPHIDENSETTDVPVSIDLAETKAHKFSFGVGYDTDIGPLATVGYENRRLNRDGHHFALDVDVSPILSSAEARYMIPFKHALNDYFSVGLGYKLEQPDTFESEIAKLSLQYQHIYANNWKQTLFLDLSQEQYTIGDEERNTLLLAPGGRWQYSTANHPLRPTEGYSLNLMLTGAPEPLISDVMFAQATADAKLITPFPWEARLITRANLGATLTDDFDDLPASYHFYAGGTETIRGYEYKELAPKDDEGNVVGGKLLTVASLEYEHFINESWGIAAFIDAGNAYNPDDFAIKSGSGLGVRWLSPIGPIRLDFAVPLDEADAAFQIHFAAGAHL